MSAAARTRPRTPSPVGDQRYEVEIVTSPCSDYAPDITFSLPDPFGPAANTSPAQRKLLSRLTRIGDQVLRRTLSDDASRVVDAELDAVEVTMQAPEVKSRESADIGDSALFMDDEDEEVQDNDGSPDGRRILPTLLEMVEADTVGGAEQDSWKPSALTAKSEGTSTNNISDKVARDAQAIVERVTTVARSLRESLNEVKHTNDLLAERIEVATTETSELQLENEALRADLASDHSELQFLKLKLKAVELRFGNMPPGSTAGRELDSNLRQWMADWQATDVRFQARRARYGMAVAPSSHASQTSAAQISTVRSTPIDTNMEVRSPKRIVSIRRSPVKRSSTKSLRDEVPPLHKGPPTPELTSASDDSDDGVDNRTRPANVTRKQQMQDLDSDGITTTDDEDCSDDEGSECEHREENSHISPNAVYQNAVFAHLPQQGAEGDTKPSSKLQRTPMQELWEGLAALAGMTQETD